MFNLIQDACVQSHSNKQELALSPSIYFPGSALSTIDTNIAPPLPDGRSLISAMHKFLLCALYGTYKQHGLKVCNKPLPLLLLMRRKYCKEYGI